MILKTGTVLLLCAAAMFVVSGTTATEAADVALGGGMDANFAALSGNNYSVWKYRINGSDYNTQHIHPKIMISISDKLSAEIYTCMTHMDTFGLITAYMDYELYSSGDFGTTNFGVKIGRFDVPFGYFNSIAINPVDQKSVSRPLMWVDHEQRDMELNGGPSPIFMSCWSEVGVQFYGTRWVRGEKDQLWFGIYSIDGLQQTLSSGSTDIKWLAMPRSQRDNNGNKSTGGRVSYSYGDLCTAGVSYVFGKYDNNDELKYSIYGGDIHVALGKSNLRFEYAANPVDWINGSSGKTEDYTKTGWYVQFDAPFVQVLKETDLVKKFEFVTMYSYLKQDKDKGNQTFLDLSRFSVGVNFSPVPAMKIRCEYQLTMPGDYNATASNVAKYGSEIKNLNRFQTNVGLAF